MAKELIATYLLNRLRERGMVKNFASQETASAGAILKGGPDALGISAEGAKTKPQESLPHKKG